MTFLDFLFGIICLLILILTFFVIKLIIMVFKHPLFGRIMGLIFAIIGFIIGLKIPSYVAGSNEAASNLAVAFVLSIIYTIPYLCALGAGSDAFDTYWDGTYSLTISKDSIDLRENISSGFIAQLGGSIIIEFILSLLAVSSLPFLLWLIPIILALVNIAMIVKVIRG